MTTIRPSWQLAAFIINAEERHIGKTYKSRDLTQGIL